MRFDQNALRIALVMMAIASFTNVYSQTSGQWIWAADDTTVNTPGVYGTKGVAAPGNRPCGRDSYATCTDSAGNFWLFGGKDKNGNFYSDLWKYNPVSRQWAWMDGPNTPNYKKVLGSFPGGTYGAVMVMDHEGIVSIFGGYGYDAYGDLGYKNELWQYYPLTASGNPTGAQQWLLLLDESAVTYGNKGTSATSNRPGARANSWMAVDAQNNLWLFGGYGLDAVGKYGVLDDLWKFNPAYGQTLGTWNWTWVSGDNVANSLGAAYLQGQEDPYSHPAGRQQFCGGMDPQGNLWIFGGNGYYLTGDYAHLNDLWKYDMSTGQWDWISGGGGPESDQVLFGSYGQKGIASPSNVPQGRYGAFGGMDGAGNFWVYGGFGFGRNMENVPGYGYVSEAGALSDLWEYSSASGNWTWIAGDSTTNHVMVAGAQGTLFANNDPGGRDSGGVWLDHAGNLWLMGGMDSLGNDRNDVWQFNTTLIPNAQLTGRWIWVGGDSSKNISSIYGQRFLANTNNKPGSRAGHSGWADASNIFWIFGGKGYHGADTGYLNDFWDDVSASGQREWTWWGGDTTIDQRGVYGTEGVFSLGNIPGARSGQASCPDRSGNYWIFGGNGYDATGVSGGLSDLWESTTGTRAWTWISGSNAANQGPQYGTKGTAATGNHPGYRTGAVLAVDPSGNIWLFGGNGVDGSSKTGDLNDLWEYIPTSKQWIWVSGSASAGAASNYSSGGGPGAREYASAFADPSGNIWIFGGYTSGTGYLSDLWEYSPTTRSWTWVNGNNKPNIAGVYGSWGTASSTNLPGGRQMQGSLVDQAGNFWIYGGQGYDEDGNLGMLGDLWEYMPSQNEWTWISGDSSISAAPLYGSKGTFNAVNKPGARQSFAFWLDKTGSLWLMGGLDYEDQYNNDLWQFTPTSSVTLPIEEVTLEGRTETNANSLTWQTIDEINTAGFEVERSTDGVNFSDIGSVTAVGSGNNSYSFMDNQLPPGNKYFYRIKMSDKDGTVTYSQTIVLYVVAATTLTVYPNPTRNSVILQLKDNSLLNTPLKLLSINGQMISEQVITSPRQLVDLSRLARGVYLLQLANGSAIKVLKE